ncbi:uncharacterized protein DNG_08001 [Cephalotrichum gorgonifer]|uniref:Uncharacterized protein n=1 Tax=Cephalotrichum gorgonifer TaxID=2041049 RepID=A0AAE8N4B7_9PEZI|nr:uncharacterized protein DNG_08001 [Cephalotrichum gorgonifer]
MSSQPTNKGKQRNPPPSLFLHPSPAASHATLPGILAPGLPASTARTPGSTTTASVQRNSAASATGSSLIAPLPGRPHRTLRTSESARSGDRTDALWAEMQATLEEVELSASGGTHVFGPDHDRKLAGLRAAQITLAQAWARSEADDVIETGIEGGGVGGAEELRRNKSTVLADVGRGGGVDIADTAKSTTGTSSARPGSSGAGAERLEAKLEEETEVDILLARKRREANDRYFQRVNRGVLDVVAKLGEVAVAMKAVEQESKDIWGDNESSPSSSKP